MKTALIAFLTIGAPIVLILLLALIPELSSAAHRLMGRKDNDPTQ